MRRLVRFCARILISIPLVLWLALATPVMLLIILPIWTLLSLAVDGETHFAETLSLFRDLYSWPLGELWK